MPVNCRLPYSSPALIGAEPRATRLVVIGEAGLDRAAIEAALRP